MIFYFSSTGNSKYAAEKIAEMNGDRLVSIGKAMKSNEQHYKIGEHEDIGFVTPVYYWGIPDIVYEFLNHVRLDGHGTDRYIYHVVTFGSVTGGANAMLMNALRKNFGLMLSATFAIRMVDNYTPLYDCSNQKKNAEVLAAAEPAIREAAEKMKQPRKSKQGSRENIIMTGVHGRSSGQRRSFCMNMSAGQGNSP